MLLPRLSFLLQVPRSLLLPESLLVLPEGPLHSLLSLSLAPVLLPHQSVVQLQDLVLLQSPLPAPLPMAWRACVCGVPHTDKR